MFKYVCVRVYMSEDTCRGQERMSDLLELAINNCETPDLGAGDQTLVLCKSSKCS